MKECMEQSEAHSHIKPGEVESKNSSIRPSQFMLMSCEEKWASGVAVTASPVFKKPISRRITLCSRSARGTRNRLLLRRWLNVTPANAVAICIRAVRASNDF